MSVGTLEPRKNIGQFIVAFRNLLEQEKIEDLNLVVVGAASSGYDKLFQRLIIAHHLEKRVIFTGYIPDRFRYPASTTINPLNVLFDHQVFSVQEYGEVSRLGFAVL